MNTPAVRRTRTGEPPARRSTLVAALAALSLVACTPDEIPAPQTSTAAVTEENDAADASTFTFGTAADPRTLDPALANDTESYRVTRQMMQGLTGLDPLTTEPVPLLAESWEERDDGRTYEFTLREDVVFHDGEPFTAEAVCANFDRWYTLPIETRGTSARLPFGTVFRAYSDEPAFSLYRGCTAATEYTVELQLASPVTGLLSALASPAFAIASPAALEEDTADDLSETRNGESLSRYGLAPVGTGPFVLDDWRPGRVDLSFFDEYWGDRGDVDHVVFTTISNPDSRARALTSGRIDGYDFVSVESAGDLARNGLQFLQRDPYSVLYLGLNQDFPGMDDPLFRRAVAHAIDKNALIDGRFLEGTRSASQFIPQKLGVGTQDVEDYGYDLDLAEALLEESGYDGTPLPFYYPRNVSRPYLPSPERVYAELSRQLTAAGFNIEPVAVEWDDDYIGTVRRSDDRAFHLLGLSGSYQDPDNFLGALFGSASAEFAYADPQLVSKIDRARSLPEGTERRDAYADISAQISRRIPAVPLAFPISALAMSPRVLSYPVSPVMNEVFNQIDLDGSAPAPTSPE